MEGMDVPASLLSCLPYFVRRHCPFCPLYFNFFFEKDMLSSFAFVYILILIRWHFPVNLSTGTCAGRADIYQQIYSNLLSIIRFFH
jgi:hypothetical protein